MEAPGTAILFAARATAYMEGDVTSAQILTSRINYRPTGKPNEPPPPSISSIPEELFIEA